MNPVIVTQARYGSSRLPGKVLMKVSGRTLLDIHLERLKFSRICENIIVATTLEPQAEEIAQVAHASGVECYRGSINDVLDRFYQTVKDGKFDVIVRVTSDCPLNDGRLIDKMLKVFQSSNQDYLSNTLHPTFADGLDIEIFSFKALKRAWEESRLDFDREHVTPFIYNPLNGFTLQSFLNSQDDSHHRITLDYPEDFQLIEHLINHVGRSNPWEDYIDYLNLHPSVKVIRKRNETTSG